MPGKRPSDGPRHLFSDWEAVAQRITRATRLAVFADFDGTLTPIRRRPASVRLDARTRRLLTRFAADGHTLGVISGRALDDVQARVAVAGIWYVGDHGFHLRAPDHHTAILVSRRQQATLARVAGRLRATLESVPGVMIEQKVATLAVHYRGAPFKSRLAAMRAVAEVVRTTPSIRLMSGKKVWELVPAVAVDKSRAVHFILRWARREAASARWLAFYVGDDIADERVFAHWRGISVVVGRRSDTAARYYLRSPAEVRDLLTRMGDLTHASRPQSV